MNRTASTVFTIPGATFVISPDIPSSTGGNRRHIPWICPVSSLLRCNLKTLISPAELRTQRDRSGISEASLKFPAFFPVSRDLAETGQR